MLKLLPTARRVRELLPAARRVRELLPAARRARELLPTARRVRELLPTARRVRELIPMGHGRLAEPSYQGKPARPRPGPWFPRRRPAKRCFLLVPPGKP